MQTKMEDLGKKVGLQKFVAGVMEERRTQCGSIGNTGREKTFTEWVMKEK